LFIVGDEHPGLRRCCGFRHAKFPHYECSEKSMRENNFEAPQPIPGVLDNDTLSKAKDARIPD
jgi:hypothetical protein